MHVCHADVSRAHVYLRVDFNVPMDGKKVTNTQRYMHCHADTLDSKVSQDSGCSPDH